MLWRVFYLFFAAAVLSAGAAAVWSYSKSTTSQLFGEIVARVEGAGPRVSLTFDDGPSARFTAEVLAQLAVQEVTATFYLTGHEAAAQPGAVAAIAAEGHEIGNHSWSHDRMILRSRSDLRDELSRTNAALRAAGYDGPLTFRPPYGQKLWSLPRELATQNRAAVMWDVALEADGRDAQSFADAIVAAAQPGSIILMHVMYRSRAVDRAALPLVIDGLRAKGFELVSISQLLDG